MYVLETDGNWPLGGLRRLSESWMFINFLLLASHSRILHLSPLAQATQSIGGSQQSRHFIQLNNGNGKQKIAAMHLEMDGQDLFCRCDWCYPPRLVLRLVGSTQIRSVETDLVPRVRQWKVARHQFQGTSIRQVVLLDTVDQLRAKLQSR